MPVSSTRRWPMLVGPLTVYKAMGLSSHLKNSQEEKLMVATGINPTYFRKHLWSLQLNCSKVVSCSLLLLKY